MSEAKHTPGTWRADGLHVFAGNVCIGRAHPTWATTPGEDAANASMFAAAPDYFAAAEAIRAALYLAHAPFTMAHTLSRIDDDEKVSVSFGLLRVLLDAHAKAGADLEHHGNALARAEGRAS